jgi:lipoyl(octanoyl) transferase
MLLTHAPVYTLGTGASLNDLGFTLDKAPCVVTRTERGGKVTYHGPGQITGYAVMDLHSYRCDLRWYVSMLEEVVIRSLGDHGIVGERLAGHHGVWVSGATRKIATIGVSASRWVTCHGFAVNVTRDVLLPFRRIVACGLDGASMTCMQEMVSDSQTCSMEQVRQTLASRFAEIFNVDLEPYQSALRSPIQDEEAGAQR